MNKEQIDHLVTARVEESRTLEYKRDLYPQSDDGKREFLKDLTAMANTQGGRLIIGVDEERDGQGRPTGVPSEANGVEVDNFDQWKQWTVNVLRDSCDPPIHHVAFEQIPGFDHGAVIVCDIPKSWLSPHRFKVRDQSYFYLRTATGNAPMDTRDMRQAFLQSATATEHMRRFREDRIAAILAGDTPVPLVGGMRFVVHILPLESFISQLDVDFAEVLEDRYVGKWMGGHPLVCRPNFDGRLGVHQGARDGEWEGLLQFYRDGSIAAVEAYANRDLDGVPMISGEYWERQVARFVHGNQRAIQLISPTGPVFVALTLVGSKGALFWENNSTGRFSRFIPINRDVLMLPEIQLEGLPLDEVGVRRLLSPAIDVAYQAAGLEKSPHDPGPTAEGGEER